MKISSVEVKTFYNITLTIADFGQSIEKYKKSEFLKNMYPNAFKDMSVTAEMPEENVIKVMGEMLRKANKETYQVLAETNGFEHWQNAGLYNPRNHTYKMVVYNCGDTINK